MRRKTSYERDMANSWDDAIQRFEKRLGGARIADLEDGSPEALRIATRSLRKEFFKLMTEDIEKIHRSDGVRRG
jgi:hypothetical protein